jgi:hypothetical protein
MIQTIVLHLYRVLWVHKVCLECLEYQAYKVLLVLRDVLEDRVLLVLKDVLDQPEYQECQVQKVTLVWQVCQVHKEFKVLQDLLVL